MTVSEPRPIPLSELLVFNAGPLQTESTLLPEEKLAALRGADHRRKWYSLDDQRICVLCDRLITGRQIEVKREAGGTYSIHCPTEGCPALPSDWFYQGSACSHGKSPTIRTGEVDLWIE